MRNHWSRLFLVACVASIGLASFGPFHKNQSAWRTSNMMGPRESQSAIVLTKTTVLVAGGEGLGSGQFSEPTRTAEVFNTKTNRWKLVGPMSISRVGQVAVKLDDGRVLVAGGADGDFVPQQSAEAFSPKTQRWSLVQSMPKPASEQAATVLRNGQVLVTGGIVSGRVSNQALLFDPKKNIWRYAVPMEHSDASHIAILLANGNVLVAGGTSPYAELYEPAHNRWIPAGRPGSRLFPAGLRIGGSDVLIAGGNSIHGGCLASALVYTGGTRWRHVLSMTVRRCAPLATSLPNGRAIVGGGFDSDTWPTLQEFSSSSMKWSAFPSLPGPRSAGSLSYINGSILAAGGSYQGSPISTSVIRWVN